MNLGKRIESRLAELNWQRKDLLDRVPDLTPQRLSALINRDSRRCELDFQIAEALGVTLLWLNEGKLPKVSVDTPPEAAYAHVSIGNQPPNQSPSPLMVAATRLDRAQHVDAATKAALTELMKTLVAPKT